LFAGPVDGLLDEDSVHLDLRLLVVEATMTGRLDMMALAQQGTDHLDMAGSGMVDLGMAGFDMDLVEGTADSGMDLVEGTVDSDTDLVEDMDHLDMVDSDMVDFDMGLVEDMVDFGTDLVAGTVDLHMELAEDTRSLDTAV
jgi:hypothetical protein